LKLGATSSGALAKREPTCDPQEAAHLATILFGCYRASDANDPETYVAAAALTLACYPEEVAREVCNPIRGLPAEDSWLPSINRIRVECDKRMQPQRDLERRDRVRAETLAGRRTGKARLGSAEHQSVVEDFRRLREALAADSPSQADRILDARTAPTPELRAQAVAYHEKRLAELARIYAASDDDARRQAESS
jgi:hypothetical protein